MAYQQTRNRTRDRAPSLHQQNIDKQILCLHQVMAEKILADHHYIPQVLDTIETRYTCGKMRYGAYLFWMSLMEHIDQPKVFMANILDNSSITKKYRRQTPLVGILTEKERQDALNTNLFL